MVIVISNSSGHEKIFKFTNITARNGNFSLQYLFPELGAYHVITRMTLTHPLSITLASFKVIVTLETSSLNIVITGNTCNIRWSSLSSNNSPKKARKYY
jgi:hypothetical protein